MFCHITTRVSTDKHQDLLQKKGGMGFPHMVVMNGDGIVLSKVRGRNIQAFTAATEAAAKVNNELIELRKKAEGDANAAKELLKKEIQLGKYMTVADAQAAIAKLELSDDEKKAFESVLGDMKISEALKGVRTEAQAIKALGPLADAGVKPTRAQSQAFQTYWIITMKYAEQNKNAKLYETALGEMKAVFGNNPRAAQFFQKAEATLAQLKAAGAGSGQ